jgi:hypothetical protein
VSVDKARPAVGKSQGMAAYQKMRITLFPVLSQNGECFRSPLLAPTIDNIIELQYKKKL